MLKVPTRIFLGILTRLQISLKIRFDSFKIIVLYKKKSQYSTKNIYTILLFIIHIFIILIFKLHD